MKKTKVFQKCFIGIFFVVAGGIYLGTSITKAVSSDVNADQLAVLNSNQEMQKLSEIESKDTSIKIQEGATSVPGMQNNNSEAALTPSMNEEKKQIVVHVCGCVAQPDVYELQENARLIDAVEAAKGFTADAARDSVNQAQLLNDGQKVYIPSKEEIEKGLVLEKFAATDYDSNNDHMIDLNHATKEELMTLPGIGDAKADKIIAYRKEHGGFQTIEDIKQIAGVKEAIFSKVKSFITVK